MMKNTYGNSFSKSAKPPLAIVLKHSFPIVRYFNGIIFGFTLVFLLCAH